MRVAAIRHSARKETILREELIHFDSARKAIQKAASAGEVKGIRDKAEALRIYAKQSGQSLEMQNKCAEIKLRAERRAGEILSEMDKNKGGRRGMRFQGETAARLADIGINKMQSHRWQKMASIPAPDFESFLAKTKDLGKELTSVAVLRFAYDLDRVSRTGPETAGGNHVTPVLSLPSKTLFSTLVVDPPWNQIGRNVDELAELPIPRMCAEDAHLYLWITNKQLPEGFELLRLWDFRYVNCLTWCRSSLEGGNYYRCSTEHILFGVRGNLELARHDVGTWFQWTWGRMLSEKPDRFYELVRACSPGPHAVLFSKRQREGWYCAGVELKHIA